MNNTATSGEAGRGTEAAKNQWMIRTTGLVLGQLRPRVLLGENAKELFTASGSGVLERLAAIGEEHGYSLSLIKTCTSLHGLPQRRERSLYVFWRTGRPPVLPWLRVERPGLALHLSAIPVSAPQQDLFLYTGRASERYRPYQYLLQRANLSHDQFYRKMATEFPGSNMTVVKYLEREGLLEDCISWLEKNHSLERFGPNTQTHVQSLKYKLKKLSMKNPKTGKPLGYWDDSVKFMGDCFSAVIKKNLFSVHPTEDRFLSIRELLHLMGLPHDFLLDDVKNVNHICQTVPVHTARAWVEQVAAFCRDPQALDRASSALLLQNNVTRKMEEKGAKMKEEERGGKRKKEMKKEDGEEDVGKEEREGTWEEEREGGKKRLVG